MQYFQHFPIDFEFDLIKPQPNTLDSRWILNDNNLDINVDMVSILESDLIIGTNSLTAIIEDDSNFIDVDNHDIGSHIYTVEWTINYTTLGIKNLNSTLNEYDILLYPNPTNNILNLKFESDNYQNLSIQIIGLDGKEVKTISVNGFGDTQIDIRNLSNGIYLRSREAWRSASQSAFSNRSLAPLVILLKIEKCRLKPFKMVVAICIDSPLTGVSSMRQTSPSLKRRTKPWISSCFLSWEPFIFLKPARGASRSTLAPGCRKSSSA